MIGIGHGLLERGPVDPGEPAVFDPCDHAAIVLIGKGDPRDLLRAALQEASVVLRCHGVSIGVDGLRRHRIDVDALEAINVEKTLDVEQRHVAIPAECDGARRLAERHAIVQKLVMHPLVPSSSPR